MFLHKSSANARGFFGAGRRGENDACSRGSLLHRRLSRPVYELESAIRIFLFLAEPIFGIGASEAVVIVWILTVYNLPTWARCCSMVLYGLLTPPRPERESRHGRTTMSSVIRFGTSGWRAVLADEFTMANVRLAVAGIAAYVKTQQAPHRVLVGRDPRFLGESFVAETSRLLAGAGVTPIVIPEAAPTPAIAYAVRTMKTSGAINFTASHNPPEYNGIKFSTHDGAPALPEVTKQIEDAINRIVVTDGKISSAVVPSGGFETADVKPD